MKLFYLIALSFFINVTANAAFPTTPLSGGGDGTQANPYKIATANDLIEVRVAIASAAGTGVALSYYELASDIDLSSVANWGGIGAYNNSFKGHFDGKGFSIAGVKAGTADSRFNSSIVGFFGFIDGATISNLTLDISFYTAFTPTTSDTGPTGGGLVNTTVGTGNNVINNCKVTGVIDVLANDASVSVARTLARVGGVIGTAGSSGSGTTTIINTSTNINLLAKNDGSVTKITANAAAICGGIVGEVKNSVQTIEIVNCSVSGEVNATSTNFGGYAGGVLSTFSSVNAISKIINTVAKNSVKCVSGTNHTDAFAGGIITKHFNANNIVNYCIALNTIISVNKNTAGDPIINRIGLNNQGVFSNNYAKSGLLVQKTIQGVGPETLSIIRVDPASKDGADMGGNPINESITKLNDYIAVNPVYSGIALTTWTNNDFTTVANTYVHNQLSLIPVVSQNTVSLDIDLETRLLQVYSLAGERIMQQKVTGSTSFSLQKGIYILNVTGYKPCKIIIM